MPILFLLVWTAPILAKSLGTIGASFPIAEPDLLAVIQTKVALLAQQGKWGSCAEYNSDFDQSLDRPTPVALSRTSTPRTWLFDPSSSANNTVINPLETVSLTQVLLFYNGDDLAQVKWAKQKDDILKGQAQLILVGGSVKSQRDLFHKPIYFDQGGRLLERFGLHQVPAIITQAGRYLKIEEVLP